MFICQPEAELTGAVFGVYRVSVVTGSTDVTVRSRRVVHAAEALSGQSVAVGEQHVGVGVTVAVARLTPAAENHGVAVETRGAPARERTTLREPEPAGCLRDALKLRLPLAVWSGIAVHTETLHPVASLHAALCKAAHRRTP